MKKKDYDICFIGGSPCVGKSTAVENLVDKYHYSYYKYDDHLDEYIKKAIKDNKSLAVKNKDFSVDDIWLRDAIIQCDEEFIYYKEMISYVIKDFLNMKSKRIIAEGVGFIPYLMQFVNKPYCLVVPTKEFQVKMYSIRPWVIDYLRQSSNKDIAFKNWMDRDALFAQRIIKEAKEYKMPIFITDKKTSFKEKEDFIIKTLNLKE